MNMESCQDIELLRKEALRLQRVCELHVEEKEENNKITAFDTY